MHSLLTRWRRTAALASTVVVAAAALSAVPATPAQAQAQQQQQSCLAVMMSANTWSTGPDTGGFALHITLTNECWSTAVGWTLQLTFAPDHELLQGWSANWSVSGSHVTATGAGWNSILEPGESTTIGFIGSYAGTYQDPLSCTINGFPCDGGGGNQPPEVTLTSPTGVVPSPCPVRFAADAVDPDGTVELVEFYANGTLVGSDDQAPYELTIPGNHPALSGSANHTAYARAYDDATPPLSGFSQEVEFTQAPPPPALMLITCNRPDTLAPGESHVVHLQSVCAAAEVDVEVTVTGDPGITADPTSFTLGPDGQDVTISAAPDSAGATATVWFQTAEDCLPVAVEVTVSGNQPPQVTLTSPSSGGGIVATCPVRLAAEATDPDGAVARVDLFVNDQLVAGDTEAPYQAQIPGSHASLEVAGQPNVAVAEVIDNGEPASSAVSQEVSFTQLFPPPGLSIVACTSSLELAAGGSQMVDFQQGCGEPEVAIDMVVDGDPGITVDPDSFVLGSGEQAVTISAAPGTEGATAYVRAQAEGCLRGTVQVTVAG